MTRKFLVLAVVGLLAVSLVASGAMAAKKGGGNTPLTATWTDQSGFGVSSDSSSSGSTIYDNGANGLQVYFGAGGKDVDVVTYNSGRKLHFKFDPSSEALAATGLPAEFDAESDLFGINYFGRYRDMTVFTTAQVQTDLEFHVGGPMPTTYALSYPALAVRRIAEDTWVVTSNPNDIPGFPGFTASDEAELNIIRRNRQTSFGTVNMPIRFEVTIK